MEVKTVNEKFLRCISSETRIILDEFGVTHHYTPEDMYECLYTEYYPGIPGGKTYRETGETEVEVYELIKDGDFNDFIVLGDDIEKRCLTPAQIGNFVDKHHEWLRKDGHSTFFLKKPSEDSSEISIIAIRFYDDGMHSKEYRLDYNKVWRASNLHRLVLAI